VDERDRHKAAFTTIYGQYHWKRLPMGLHSAVAEWQASMDRIFAEYMFKFLVLYIDDGIIYSNSFEDHLSHTAVILK
jgi:hypothetical protein